MYGIMEFIATIHSGSNWKIDVLKTGGLLYFSPALTSPDMTQPADNINVNTTRHLSMTVTHYNGVVYYVADMQTQDTEWHDKSQAFTSQQNTIAGNLQPTIRSMTVQNIEHLMYQTKATEFHRDHVT